MELSRTDVVTLTNYGSALQAAAKTESAIATFERAHFVTPTAWPPKSTWRPRDSSEVNRAIDIFEK